MGDLEWLYIAMDVGAAVYSFIQLFHLQEQFCIWSLNIPISEKMVNRMKAVCRALSWSCAAFENVGAIYAAHPDYIKQS